MIDVHEKILDLTRRFTQVLLATAVTFGADVVWPEIPTRWQALMVAGFTLVAGAVTPLDRYGWFTRVRDDG